MYYLQYVQEKPKVTLWKKKSKSKVEYRWTEDLMRRIAKSVIKSVENKWIKDKWGSTKYNVLGVQQTTHAFLIWGLQVHVSDITCLSTPDQWIIFNNMLNIKQLCSTSTKKSKTVKMCKTVKFYLEIFVQHPE